MKPNVGENQHRTEVVPTSNSEQVPNESVEKNPMVSPENSPQTQSVAISSQAASDVALPSQAIATVLSNDGTVLPVNLTSAQADDTDRIEKEWVDKAKTVIEHTKDDPYEQKNKMSRVKADYIQKRFNKTIKAEGS